MLRNWRRTSPASFNGSVRGEEQLLVQENMLYCLALMQHHGAPTRLLDATYSPFVAAQTALRDGLNPKRVPVIWCFNADWMEKHCARILGQIERNARFNALRNRTPPPLLVMHENPDFLNLRLTAHQGVFLCAGNLSEPFDENLKAMIGWNSRDNVRKLHLCFERANWLNAVKTLKRMNVSSTVLFPGLDGFARSLGEELPQYDEIYGGD